MLSSQCRLSDEARWLETDPASTYHQPLVAGLPTFLPGFGDLTTQQISEIGSGTGLRQMLAARAAGAHIPAETAAEVGGDWFDVITLRPGRCAPIVGDVTGHDMRAASLMGQFRTATRTLATLDLAPAEILTRLDRITADLTNGETSAACVYAINDTSTGEWDMARAGPRLPAVVRPGHAVTFLDLPRPRRRHRHPDGPGLKKGPCPRLEA